MLITTRFVYEWRKKSHKSGAETWMGGSCFVAREFANEKHGDTDASATACHTASWIPLIYLNMLGEELEGLCNNDAYKVALYQRCVPSSPSASDHWCDTLQHQILSFSQFAGAALRVRVPGIGTLETMCRRRWIAVGARNNLLLEGAQ
jgi:hypothetical protein